MLRYQKRVNHRYDFLMAGLNRPRDKREKPVKKHRDGYTGKRAEKNKMWAKERATKKKGQKPWKKSTQSKFLNKDSLTWKNLRTLLLKKFKTSPTQNSDGEHIS